jgi:UDP-glucose 4-epimerase
MEVIVTGGAGYIGAHIANDLLVNGHKVIIVDNFSTGFRQFVNPGAKLVTGSVEEPLTLENAFALLKSPQTAGVIHTAGLKFAGESMKEPLDFYIANTFATVNLLKHMKKFEVHNLIFSSSSSVYGNTESDELILETNKLNPLSPYGKSKLFAEEIIQDAKREFLLNAISIRYFNVIGNGLINVRDTSKWNLLPNIYRAIQSRSTLQVYGDNYKTPDGSCIRDYVDVVSLAIIHSKILKNLLTNSFIPSVLNLGSGVGVSVLEIIEIVKENIDPNFKFNIVSGRPGDPAKIIADCTLARQSIGWNPDLSIKQMVVSGWKAWENEKLVL